MTRGRRGEQLESLVQGLSRNDEIREKWGRWSFNSQGKSRY